MSGWNVFVRERSHEVTTMAQLGAEWAALLEADKERYLAEAEAAEEPTGTPAVQLVPFEARHTPLGIGDERYAVDKAQAEECCDNVKQGAMAWKDRVGKPVSVDDDATVYEPVQRLVCQDLFGCLYDLPCCQQKLDTDKRSAFDCVNSLLKKTVYDKGGQALDGNDANLQSALVYFVEAGVGRSTKRVVLVQLATLLSPVRVIF